MFIDPITYTCSPKKIISLVPSITELLFELKLEEETIGITKFCVHPAEWLKTKEIIGGTKNINIKKIIALKPDLIICNKEENVKEQVEELSKMFSVFVTDVNNYEQALQMIHIIGRITNREKEAIKITTNIENAFVRYLPNTEKKITTAYLIWQKPYITVGGDTFINEMMTKMGLQNIYAGINRYPQININDLQEKMPQVILLSTEPYPFKEKHVSALKSILPNSAILLVDGEMFSWYGSRMLLMPEYLQKLLNDIKKNVV